MTVCDFFPDSDVPRYINNDNPNWEPTKII